VAAGGAEVAKSLAVPTPPEPELLEIAEAAADAAAGELRARFGGQASGVRSKSTPTDLVSEADVAAERAIRDVLARRRPKDSILGEEGGASGDGALRWVVDPLDGTINYLYRLPVFAVSVACEDADGALAGIVLDPLRGERFTATRSGEAQLNGAPIHGTEVESLGAALVATGFAYDAAVRERQAAVIARILPAARDIRRAGAAAIDLCWAACGRVDAYYERGLQPWDRAAGALIAARAGLDLRELPGHEGWPAGLLAAPPGIADELQALVELPDGA
jgi:myo-inositol-1(or 4)-monophosphatase